MARAAAYAPRYILKPRRAIAIYQWLKPGKLGVHGVEIAGKQKQGQIPTDARKRGGIGEPRRHGEQRAVDFGVTLNPHSGSAIYLSTSTASGLSQSNGVRAGSNGAFRPSRREEGYVRIDGRTKDIIIRGGENVPIVEIAGLLFKHPAVLAAALVGDPDSRLGERACAFLSLRPGHSIDLKAVRDHLAGNKVAKQYWPERIVIAEELPKTPAGKIQKFQLREKAKAFGDVAAKASA